MAAPHLAGHVVMRFLDPDESDLRLLSSKNPFGAWSRPPRDPGSGSGVGRKGLDGVDNDSAVATLTGDQADEEDFDNLTESLGGFG